AMVAGLRFHAGGRRTDTARHQIMAHLLAERDAARLRRAVNLNERHADGAEEAYDPRRDRRCAGHRYVRAAQADIVLQRAEDRQVGDAVAQLLADRAFLPGLLRKRLAVAIGPLEQATPETARLQHADVDRGMQLLPYARHAEEHVGRHL